MAKRVSVSSAGVTDAGLARTSNEDSLFQIERSAANAAGASTYGLYLIADGMGGHSGGEVASTTAMRTISTIILESLRANTPIQPTVLIRDAIERAHRAILTIASADRALRSMGTTVTVGLRLDLELYLGHVGDCRAYLARDGRLHQLTEDHSVVAALLRQGDITPQQAISHPDKGKILRCLGVTQHVDVDTRLRETGEGRLTLRPGDRLVFCSDGLTQGVSDVEILDCVQRWRPRRACGQLVRLANAKGGTDNTSVIVVMVR